MAPDDDDRKVKDLIDAATREELAKWFGLPSFQELEERGEAVAPPEDDPEVLAVRQRRDAAIAAVDPALLAAHARRTEPPEDLIRFKPLIEVRVDPSVASLDLAMIDRQHTIAEPREVEIPEALREDLRECTPQALLRDLHRPELHFDKTFEVVDMAAEQTLDIVAAVKEAMATSWKLPPLTALPSHEARAAMLALKAEHRSSWPALLGAKPLPNRRWTAEGDQ